MPVFKYRDVFEMPGHHWLTPGSPALFLAMARVWRFAARTCPVRFPPGVHRHRSAAAARRRRDEWVAAASVGLRPSSPPEERPNAE